MSSPTISPASPLTVEPLADRLVAAWPEYLAGVAAIGKPDTAWRTLDSLVKSGKCSRAFIVKHSGVTRDTLRKHGIPFHTPEDRQRLLAAWQLARPRLPIPVKADDGR